MSLEWLHNKTEKSKMIHWIWHHVPYPASSSSLPSMFLLHECSSEKIACWMLFFINCKKILRWTCSVYYYFHHHKIIMMYFIVPLFLYTKIIIQYCVPSVQQSQSFWFCGGGRNKKGEYRNILNKYYTILILNYYYDYYYSFTLKSKTITVTTATIEWRRTHSFALKHCDRREIKRVDEWMSAHIECTHIVESHD